MFNIRLYRNDEEDGGIVVEKMSAKHYTIYENKILSLTVYNDYTKQNGVTYYISKDNNDYDSLIIKLNDRIIDRYIMNDREE